MPRPAQERRDVAKIYRGREMARARAMKGTSSKEGIRSFLKITRRIHRQILNKKN